MPAPATLYGLKNCDGCRRARKWFDAAGVAHDFRDIRERDNTTDVLARIRDHDDWPAFVNRRSTTWRSLPAAQREDLDRTRAMALLAEHPTLIKRPVIAIGETTLAGFDADAVEAALART